MKANPNSTLEKVAGIGYNQLELAGYDSGKFYGFQPQDFKKSANDLGLEVISTHVMLAAFKQNADLVISSCSDLGVEYIVIPWLNAEERQTIQQYDSLIGFMNDLGAKCVQNGMKLVYHNHDFEFDSIEGIVPMNRILEKTNPLYVNIELDLYWVSKAGFDPVELFDKYPGRFPIWHVKDMDATEAKHFTEVGNGVIDFNTIFENAETAGMKYFFVEQDVSENPLKSVEISYGNVVKLLDSEK